jgi:flagellar biosynthesis protein FlhG
MLDMLIDQAAGLRALASHSSAGDFLRVVPLVRGMRGVGHTSTTVNLAAALGTGGQRVVVLDAGRALVAAALNLKARYELLHLMRGEKSIDETLLRSALFDVLPASKGIKEFLASGMLAADLFSGFAALAVPYNMSILAVSSAVAAALTPSDCEIVFVTNDTTDSLKSTYTELKHLVTDYGHHRFRIIFNDIVDPYAAQDSYARLADTAQKYFQAELALGGMVPRDLSVRRATAAITHIFTTEPTEAHRAYVRIAANMDDWKLASFSRIASSS